MQRRWKAHDMRDTVSIFDRYQAIRHRLPAYRGNTATRQIRSLTEISDVADAFVFDAFGVLNVGETLIEGADRRVDQLRQLGCHIRILTNAASYNHAGAAEKFRKLGIAVEYDEIITSRDAALAHVTDGLWGCIAAEADHLDDIERDAIRLGDCIADFDRVDGFLFLSASGWTNARQNLLKQSLAKRDRPVLVANADLVAPRDDGFSLEPGYFGHQLLDDGARNVRFFGKPFPEVFDMVERSLAGLSPDRIVMCGDTLHTDILGAAARGWQTALVTQDGLFAGHDTRAFSDQSGLRPTWRMQRI